MKPAFALRSTSPRRELPWVSLCSDAPSLAAEGLFLKSSVHPRAYGSFARLLGKYVREEKLVSLEEAIRKMTALPAANLRLDRRGMLQAGYFADVAVFDPSKIQDHATFDNWNAGQMKILFDTDIGSDIDDALALLLLLRIPDVELIGVTTVYGCTDIRAKVAKKILDAAQRSVPVISGCGTPLGSPMPIWQRWD